MATDFLIDGQIKGGNSNATGSTGVTIALNKTTLIGDTAAKTYVLPVPVAGATLRLIKTTTTTAGATVNSTISGAAATITNSTAVNLIFTAQGQSVELLASSATKWEIVSNVGSVTLT